ncbi:IclR family transcriptional regulator [Aureimonas pseudogalii]|uniref:DNA-binding IclR family transcriptional regulator n=1 Tax=Aureimonas pseudogalii TaxID=1744844 RepID=A0A7W6MLZ5_9HYPH|nr:IclR family transcriptional regulator [Aureimonas pseudogalii]MBB4000274.1 DNA-binding IclR family transcriptional regulator [Aureimonas pseudogalii]
MSELFEPRTAGATPALRRAIEVLDLLESTSEPLAAVDIARELGLPKSSAHGLIATMMEFNLVVRGADGRFRLGPRLMRWASGFLSQTNLTGEFQRYLTGETNLNAHTITLTILDGREVVYVACRDSGDPLGLTFRIGMRLPAPYTATGKALLAAMPAGDLDRLFADPKNWPAPLTPLGVGSLNQLRQELDLVRRRGYSIDDGQVREGMICLGASIQDHSGCAIAGIAVSLIRNQASTHTLDKLGADIRTAADAIARRLGN